MIARCELEPGARLTERGLIERLDAGRTPVREALLRLSQDCLVDIMPRSGYRVRPLTRKDVADTFVIWRLLGPLIAEQALSHMDDALKKKIQALHRKRDAIRLDDFRNLNRIASQFFDLLVTACDSEPIRYCYEHITAQLDRIFTKFYETDEGRRWLEIGHKMVPFDHVLSPEIISRQIAAAESSILSWFDTEVR